MVSLFSQTTTQKLFVICQQERVMDFVHEVVCDVIGGTPDPKSKDSSYCRLVCQVVSVPSFFVKKNKILRQLPEVTESAITGGKFNNRRGRI